MSQLETKSGQVIHRETGQTFYWATRMLPERIRQQTYTLYGFLRVADEIVDGENGLSDVEQRRKLDEIRAVALGQEGEAPSVVSDFAAVRAESSIPSTEIDHFIDAMQSDTRTVRYETHEQLDGYMRGSAAAVGNMMLAIMDASEPPAVRRHAMALGEAFQLSNFIRDVGEDYRELDRIYLPRETRKRFNVSERALGARQATPGLCNAVEAELERAERRYRVGVRGIELLPRDCQFPVLLASVLYAEHHRCIRDQEYDVLARRPTLSRRRKLWTLGRTWWHWKRCKDPVTVFGRVSPIRADRPAQEAVHRPPEVPLTSE